MWHKEVVISPAHDQVEVNASLVAASLLHKEAYHSYTFRQYGFLGKGHLVVLLM